MTLARRYIEQNIIPAMERLIEQALAMEQTHSAALEKVHPAHLDSARNLLHYLALRQTDIRELQKNLALLGLSRLGRAEAHVLGSMEAILRALRSLAGVKRSAAVVRPMSIDVRTGALQLAEHTRELLGHAAGKRTVRIMVTMPSEAATDPALVRELLAAGMDIMRINCAHDGPEAWRAMIGNARLAEKALGRSCKIYADLAGPKLRTGPIEPVGRLIEFSPRRDFRGTIVRPARLWLTARDTPAPSPEQVDAVLPVEPRLLGAARRGDKIELLDSRGSRREITMVAQAETGWFADSLLHIYVEDGAKCRLLRAGKVIARGNVGPLPEVVLPILLRVGAVLNLTPDTIQGHPARFDAEGKQVEPASIPCTLAEVFDAARPGQQAWFDDGKIGATIREVDRNRIELRITHAGPEGSRLRPEKGINLPDTDLRVPALTAKDLDDLRVMAPLIDIVGLSFVRRAEDVLDLQARLKALEASRLGTVLKVETRQAFENLPRILLASLRNPPVGVMLARGDLAVEVGFERLAELQEEILWLCEAAHVPVVWATQVLETMAKKGLPSRAEVSDAAMSVRAECVMLNKGPYIVDTVRFLSGVLERMSTHSAKRRPMLRRLSVSAL